VSVGAFGRIVACASALVGCAPGLASQREAPLAPPPVAASPATALIEWDARSGTLRCRSSKIAIPEALRGQVRWSTPHELTLVPSRSPPGGALVVTLMDAVDDDRPLTFLEDSPRMWIDLHLLAVGGDLAIKNAGAETDQLQVRGNLEEDGDRVITEYDLGEKHGKAILLQVGRCRIRALDFPIPTAAPMLTGLINQLVTDPNLDGPP
jgi:hypothetical protein